MFHRLLVPLDGTKAAEGILPLAKALLKDNGSHLILLEVTKPDREAERKAEEDLKKITKRFTKTVESVVVPGAPDEEILRQAHRHTADGIAISAHTVSSGLGHVAKSIIERAAIPVVVWIPQRGQKTTPSKRPKKILIPLDGTLHAERVLPTVVEMLDEHKDTSFTLMRVGLKTRWSLGSPSMVGDSTSAIEDYLLDCKERVGGGDRVQVEAYRGDAARQIILNSKKHDMVLMASHHRRGLSRWLQGSVARKLIDKLPVPLMVV